MMKRIMLLYLNKTGNHHREYTALYGVSVESFPHKHDEEQEVTKEAKDDEDRIQEYYKYQEIVVPDDKILR